MYGDRSRPGAIGSGEDPRSDEVNVLALVKCEERFIFLYSDDQRDECLRNIGRWAANPELTFSWYDAAVLTTKIRARQA